MAVPEGAPTLAGRESAEILSWYRLIHSVSQALWELALQAHMPVGHPSYTTDPCTRLHWAYIPQGVCSSEHLPATTDPCTRLHWAQGRVLPPSHS